MSDIQHPLSERSPSVATLFRVYQPIEHYLRLCAPALARADAAHVSLSAIDAFLLHAIATYYPGPLSVIDLAADATAGVSTFFWATQERVSRVVAAHAGGTGQCWDWHACLRDASEELGIDITAVTLSDATLDAADEWRQIRSRLSPLSSVLITLAAPEDADQKMDEQLGRVFALFPDAIVFVLPVGLIGDDPILDATLAFCTSHPDHRLIALREISPFFASSRLGIVSKRKNASIPDVIERIQQLYEGNFQFITLVRELTKAALHEDELAPPPHQEEPVPRAFLESLASKNEYILWLESRLNMLERELLPWKNEYIVELETQIRNLTASKALRVSSAAQHLARRVTSLRNGG